jgi:hypothetical protein
MITQKIKSSFSSVFSRKNAPVIPKKPTQLKKKDLNIEEFLKDFDSSSINREMAVKKINQKLQNKRMDFHGKN